MMIERFQNGQIVDLATSILVSTAGAILTGLVNVTVRVRRESDDFWLDWNDNTFKAAGWTTLDGAMSEVDATRAAGVYARAFPTTGFADDRYYARMSSPSAFNSPQEASALVGEWIDNIDVAITTRASAAALATVQADTDDIQTRLPATLSGGRMRSQVEGLDADTITATALAASATAEIDAVLSAAHGAGAWDATAAAQTIRDAMKLAPTAGAPAAGSVDEHLDDILADTAAMQPLVDVAISTRAAPGAAMALTPGERTTLSGVIDAALSAAHGAGSWATATGFAVPGDAMALTPGERTTLSGAIDAALSATHGAGLWDGAGFTPTQDDRLREVWTLLGANIAAPASFDATLGFVQALADGIDIAIGVAGTTVTLTRQP
jgi:hypothetical protein